MIAEIGHYALWLALALAVVQFFSGIWGAHRTDGRLMQVGHRATVLQMLMMLLAFIFGITWVWSNGINIDCGCFGTGGEVSAEQTQYPLKIAENVGMSALCLWLMVRPRSIFSLEQALFGSPVRLDDQSDDDPVTAEDSATADIKE